VLLANSGFEASTLQSWAQSGTLTAALTASQKYSGSQSMQLTCATSGADAYMYGRYANPLPNTQYTFSAWVYVASITGAPLGNRAIFVYDGSMGTQTSTMTTGRATGVWVRETATFTTSAAPSYLELRLYAPQGVVYWDAAQIEIGNMATAYAPAPGEILPGTISTTQIADNSITTSKIIAGAVVAGSIAAGTITSTQIAATTITGSNIAAGTITGNNLVANTITAGDIAANTITAAQIAAGTITTSQIAAGTIQASNIAAGTITGDRIAANTITAGDIASNTITAGCIAAGAIGATQIAAGAITTASLTVANFDNLIPNPTSVLTTPQGTAWPASSYENVGLIGTGSNWALTPSGGCRCMSGNGSFQAASIAGNIPASPGDYFYFECYAATNDPGGALGCQVSFRAANDAYLQDHSTGSVPYDGAGLSDGNPPKISVVIGPAPAGTASVRVWMINNSASGVVTYFNRFYLRRMADANLIVDGTVTTTKLVTGAAIADIARVGSLTAGYIYFTDGFCLNTLEPKEAGANVTSAHVLTAMARQTATATASSASNPGTSISGLTFSLNAASTSDVYNFFGSISGEQTAGTPGYGCNINLYVDGVYNQAVQFSYATLNGMVSNAFVMSLTGLSAGAHTLQFYLSAANAGETFQTYVGSNILCQRIF